MLKRTIVDLLIIIVAVAGVTLLLKRGDAAGRLTLPRVTMPAGTERNQESTFPRTIWGRLDNFKEPIRVEPLHSWGNQPRNGFKLRASDDTAVNRPSARLILIHPVMRATVLEIQYAMPQDIVEMIMANDSIRDKTDGVTVLISAVGVANNRCTFLVLDPVRSESQRQWMTHYLALPAGTIEVDFSIIGPPPAYNIFWDNCAISLPQVRLFPAQASQ